MLAKGVKLGDFVTIALPNGIGFFEATIATWKLGATRRPMLPTPRSTTASFRFCSR